MSELSTVAIKDGHRGHPHHHSTHSRLQTATSDTCDSADAERADRISRLPGLERAHTVRQNSSTLVPDPSTPIQSGYFEPSPATVSGYHKERSTVGSASATGSVGGRTTWASGSDAYDATDKMSEDQDQDMDTNSVGGFSEEGNASLVGFGEGAGSTVSGPISSFGPRTPQRQSGAFAGRTSAVPPHVRDTPTTPRDLRMVDAYDLGTHDAPHASGHYADHQPRGSLTGAEQAEQIMSGSFSGPSAGGMHQAEDRNLGSFPFEQSK